MNTHDPVSRSRRWRTPAVHGLVQTLLMEMPWSLDGQPLPLTEKAEAAPKRKLHRTDEKSNQVHSRHMYVLYFSSLSLYLAPIISGGVSMTICSFS